MKDMGRVMALVKERLGGVDRAGAGVRAGEGCALARLKRAPPRVRRSPIDQRDFYLAAAAGASAGGSPISPMTPSMVR